MSAIYEGYHREWLPDPDWRFGTKYTKCRQPHCPNPPVAEFDRLFTVRGGRRVPRAYAYCEQHLYGRKIENGQVLHWVLVPDDEATLSNNGKR